MNFEADRQLAEAVERLVIAVEDPDTPIAVAAGLVRQVEQISPGSTAKLRDAIAYVRRSRAVH